MAITDGLVLQLEGPTGLVDQSTVGVTGQTYNGGMGTVLSDGRLAFSTDGIDDFIDIPLAAVPAAFPWSISFWVKSAGMSMVALNRTFSSVHYVYFVATDTVGRLQTRRTTTLNESLNTVNTLTANTWNHVCCTMTSVASRRVVLNGDIANSASSSADSGMASPADLMNTFTVGKRQTSSGNTFYAQLTDSIRAYNRVISDAEIQFLASARGAGTNYFLKRKTVTAPIFHNPIQPVIF